MFGSLSGTIATPGGGVLLGIACLDIWNEQVCEDKIKQAPEKHKPEIFVEGIIANGLIVDGKVFTLKDNSNQTLNASTVLIDNGTGSTQTEANSTSEIENEPWVEGDLNQSGVPLPEPLLNNESIAKFGNSSNTNNQTVLCTENPDSPLCASVPLNCNNNNTMSKDCDPCLSNPMGLSCPEPRSMAEANYSGDGGTFSGGGASGTWSK